MRKQWWVIVLLVLATMHCAQSIFFDNYSYLDLQKFESGSERMPYQGRVAMMPLLAWAHGNAAVTRYAHTLEQETGNQHVLVEKYTAEKFVCYAAGVASFLLIVGICGWYGKKVFPDLWWLCPALLIAIFYVSYAARAEQNLWYPYDLPHAALFTLMCVALLEEHLGLLLGVFLLDTPMRETAIYIVPCVLAVGYSRRKLKYAGLAGVLALLWIGIRALISRHTHGLPTDVGFHYHEAYHAFRNPKHWPQLASVFGFLGLPLVLNRHLLNQDQRAFLVGAIPGVAMSALLGVLIETRVWAEWNGIVACLVFTIAANYLRTSQGISYFTIESVQV